MSLRSHVRSPARSSIKTDRLAGRRSQTIAGVAGSTSGCPRGRPKPRQMSLPPAAGHSAAGSALAAGLAVPDAGIAGWLDEDGRSHRRARRVLGDAARGDARLRAGAEVLDLDRLAGGKLVGGDRPSRMSPRSLLTSPQSVAPPEGEGRAAGSSTDLVRRHHRMPRQYLAHEALFQRGDCAEPPGDECVPVSALRSLQRGIGHDVCRTLVFVELGR